MPPAPSGITQANWPASFPADVQPVISAIVGGAPFARSLSPIPTRRTAATFPLVEDVSQPAWGGELSEVPVLDLDSGEYDAAVSRLSGSILISQESISDSDWPLTPQIEAVLRDTFSAKLDRDFISGTGPHPTPTGILAVASAVDGLDLELAAAKAKGQIGTAGGHADCIALSPALIAELESARDSLGRALYPEAEDEFAGLTTVRSVAATQAVVYDSTRLYLVINRDFTVDYSAQVSEAWNRFAQSMRVVARFALAAPMPSKSVRKLTVTPEPGAARSATARK
jgi:HK97 family phage major capsid protein